MDAKKTLAELSSAGLLRSLKNSSVSGSRIEMDGSECLNFASNDYLGLTGRPDFQREFLESIKDCKKFVMGAASSRLLGGNNFAFAELEKFLSEVYSEISNSEKSALLFNCGYHANTGILPALASSEDLILADKLSHASIIDSLKLSDAKWARFKHNDLSDLRRILEKRRGEFKEVFIATESVFSMDGDIADIAELVKIKEEFGARLYVDEAHAFGVFGPKGLGLCAASGRLADIDIAMCTLGKAAAGEGAFAVCSPEIRALLINRCRPFIFTTAIAPINALWARFICEKIFSADALRAELRRLSALLKDLLGGIETLGDSQIVPIIVGDEKYASEFSAELLRRGIYAPAIRYPTVAKGAARLRASVTAAVSESEIKLLAEEVGLLMGRK